MPWSVRFNGGEFFTQNLPGLEWLAEPLSSRARQNCGLYEQCPNKLVIVFSAPGWKRFVDALANFRNRGKTLPASISIADATDDERRCYTRLLRLKQPPASPALRCDLQHIATALAQQGIETDWPALLEALCGPVPEELRANRANQRAWDDFWPWAAEHVAKQQFPCAADWLKSLRADGSLIRLSKGDAAIATERVRRACAVLTQLPLMNEPLPGAAARLCGNSHALDPDSPLATLILRSLAMQRATSVPDRSDDRRQLWSTSASFATTSVPRSRNRVSP